MQGFVTTFKEKSVIAQFGTEDVSKDMQLADFVKTNGKFIEYISLKQKDINQKHVVVVGGGMSAERDVSYISSNGIVKSIIELGYYVTFVDMGADISYVLSILKPNIVYNALHGTYGEDGCLPGLLNIMQIPYTGPGVLASSIAFNKKKSYEIFTNSNIKIVKNIIVKKSDQYKTDPIKRPYVIKPLTQGSSVGIEIIFADDKFNFGNYDFPYGDEVLVEEYITGREMQVAVLHGKAIGVLEIKLLKGKRFYDYETKYTEGFAEHLLPAPVAPEIYEKMKNIAEKACRILHCIEGIIRVELIYCPENNNIYTLEVNTHPGMTPLSICPEILQLENISYTDLVQQMLDSAKFE